LLLGRAKPGGERKLLREEGGEERRERRPSEKDAAPAVITPTHTLPLLGINLVVCGLSP
jgi:hypothetical protein